MQFFIDTADTSAITKYAQWGIVDGVTTNPSLIAKEGVDLKTRILEITQIVDGPISCEVIASDVEGMVKEARDIASWHPNVNVKIPITSEGLQVVKILSKEGIQTNVTLIFSLSQAMMAAKAGATYISPFIGRVDDLSDDGMQLLTNIMEVFDLYQIETKVIAASIRHPLHVMQSMKIGADIATIPPGLFEKLVHHPLTEKGIESFMSDWEKVKNKQK